MLGYVRKMSTLSSSFSFKSSRLKSSPKAPRQTLKLLYRLTHLHFPTFFHQLHHLFYQRSVHICLNVPLLISKNQATDFFVAFVKLFTFVVFIMSNYNTTYPPRFLGTKKQGCPILILRSRWNTNCINVLFRTSRACWFWIKQNGPRCLLQTVPKQNDWEYT